MPTNQPAQQLLPKERTPKLKRAMGIYHSPITTRILIPIALIAALFGGVGVDVCLSQPAWEKHLWLPSMLILFAAWIFVSTLIHGLRVKLFGRF